MTTETITSISCQQLHELSEREDVDLIDVRMPTEFRELHATIARNVPLDCLDPAAVMAQRNGTADQPLYMICQAGVRSGKACQKFVAAGFTNVVNVEGGTMGWAQAGLPVQRGKRAMALERQVRIGAGLIILTGSALGLLVHPYWFGLPAMVGAGLTFAGITDTCWMGMCMARAPWNQ